MAVFPSGAPTRPRRSRFVTIVGWLCLAGCALVALQAGLIAYALGRPEAAEFLELMRQELARNPEALGDVHPLQLAMLQHPRTTALVLFNLAVLGACVAIALIRRLAWSRPAMACLLGLVIAASLVEMFWQTAHLHTAVLPAERVLRLAFPICSTALFGWMAIRLLSPALRAEFDDAEAGPSMPTPGPL